MLDRATSVDVRFGRIYQDPSRAANLAPMSQAMAWAVVIAFFVAVGAMGAAPFVEERLRVVAGITAGLSLIAFFALVGCVKAARVER